MTLARLEELERWVESLGASGLIDGPLVEALREIRRAWKELLAIERYAEKLKDENDKLLDDLNWYHVEAVARTNTDGRTTP